jgi:hypothetical protein
MKPEHEIYYDIERTKPVTDYEVNEDGDAIIRDGIVHVFGLTHVHARGNSRVFCYEYTKVYGHDNTNILAHHESHVIAYGTSCIVATHRSFVKAYGNSCVTAAEHATVVPLGNSMVYAYGNSIIDVHGDGTPTVILNDNSRIHATSDIFLETAIYSFPIRHHKEVHKIYT